MAEAAGDAEPLAPAFFSARRSFRASCAAFSCSVNAPTFSVFTSRLPSEPFKYDPRASSFATTSLIVAVCPVFVIAVLSVTLNVRDFSLPVIVNVFAFESTDEIIPWNGIARVLPAEAAGLAEAEALAAGVAVGEADFLGRGNADAVCSVRAATKPMIRYVLCFIVVRFCT